MKKYFIFVIFLLSLLFFSKCKEGEEEEYYSDYDNNEVEEHFNETLKKYLIENNLLESERIIQRDEMRRIFLEIITDGDPEPPEYLNGIIMDLVEYFVNLYYKDRKEIKGKDIINLIDINQISMKFQLMLGNSPYFNGEEEEEINYDKRDVVGESIPDI